MLTPPPTLTHPRLSDMMDRARACGPLRVGVVYPCEKIALASALDAHEHGFIDPVLIGPLANIEAAAAEAERSLTGLEIVPAESAVAAARLAVSMAGAGEVSALMKGSLHTDELLGAVVGRESPLRTGRRVSHVFWFDCPAYHKPLMITDAVVNVAPGLAEKADILRSAIELAHGLGIAIPKVAILAAVETVNPAFASTVEAAALCKMADRGQITGALLDGPLAFDNAISAASAHIKGIASEVAGEADILLVPDLTTGNSLYKSIVYLGGAACAGLVLGSRVPIILTSRADSRLTRIASCALAALTSPVKPTAGRSPASAAGTGK